MRRQKSRTRLTGGIAGRLLKGAVGLLLAACVIACGVMPGYADVPPEVPHYFSGSVSFNGDPVEEGTLVKAFVGGGEAAWTTVDDQSRYALGVPGTAGAEVTFEVGGVPANETATWQSGKVQQLNLTIDEPPGPPVPRYTLTMAADPALGGSATDQTGTSPYAAGAEVSIRAAPNPGYAFVGWTANTTAAFGNATAAETTFTMPDQTVAVTAHFEAAYDLTMAADPVGGGDAIDVAVKGAYAAGATVRIKAVANSGYGFVDWTAGPTVTFADATAPETTFTMPAQAVTVTAHFGVAYDLTMVADPVGGGNAIDVGVKGAYAAGATVRIEAVANPGYAFGNWTADATITFGSVTAAETTFTMPPQAVTVTAHFEQVSPPPGIPTVTTIAATDISSYAATIHMSYTLGYFTPVEVRFACKRPTDPAWFYTSWVSRTADGNYTEVLSGLVSQTQYQFKAQLRYDSTVIEGDASQFATAAGSSTNLNDLLAYFGCFIATAAYGTPTAEQIDVLREFRDVVLLKSALGSRFVALYYRLSPPVADFVARNEVVRTLVRELLVDPIVWLVEATGDKWRN
jgi:uncharacterized repeat protein (TIGR02543 family)